MHICPLPLESPSHLSPLPTPSGFLQSPSWVPCQTANSPWCLFTYVSVYASVLLSPLISPSPSSPRPLSIKACSPMSASPLLFCEQVHQYHASAAAAAKSLQSCPTLRPHRRQPTRLRCPWDSWGENTGVGCHFLLQCMKVKIESEVTESCLTLSDPMDCSLPGSSIHGIFQARVLEWDAIRSPTMLLDSL